MRVGFCQPYIPNPLTQLTGIVVDPYGLRFRVEALRSHPYPPPPIPPPPSKQRPTPSLEYKGVVMLRV